MPAEPAPTVACPSCLGTGRVPPPCEHDWAKGALMGGPGIGFRAFATCRKCGLHVSDSPTADPGATRRAADDLLAAKARLRDRMREIADGDAFEAEHLRDAARREFHATVVQTSLPQLALDLAAEVERLRADAARLDAMQTHQWAVNVNHRYIYVGPLGIAGKPWGVSLHGDLREAIDDALTAISGSGEEASG